MMLLYTLSDGFLYRIPPVTPISVTPIGRGYSGNGQGLNNWKMDDVPNIGPLPTGLYTIGEPFDSPEHGPECLPLTPSPDTNMHGRSGFLVHGDSKTNPGCASRGCLILPKVVRDLIVQTPDKDLRVVA